MVHKRAFNYVEVLDVFDDELKAIEARDEYNKIRPDYAKAVIKKREVKK